MDEWIPLDNMNLETVIAPEPSDGDARKKRKVEAELSEEEGEVGLRTHFLGEGGGEEALNVLRVP
jgi:hypothetical protein